MGEVESGWTEGLPSCPAGADGHVDKLAGSSWNGRGHKPGGGKDQEAGIGSSLGPWESG